MVAERDKIVAIARKERNYYDAILSVYSYFVKNYNYSDHDEEAFHQIYSPLLYQKAVCEGFSLLFSEVLNIAHIPCGVISGVSNRNGKQEPHSWNVVKYKNCYYHLDVTWDICTKNTHCGFLSYFMVDDRLISKDHSWNDDSIPKCTDSTEEYFAKKKMACRNRGEIISYLVSKIRKGESQIGFRALNEQINDDYIESIINDVFRISKTAYSQISYSNDRISGVVVINIKS